MASKNKRTPAVPASTKQPAAGTNRTRTAGDVVRAGMDGYDKIVWYCLHALLIAMPIALSNLTFLGIGNGLPVTYDQFDIAKVFVMRAITLVALGVWAWKMLTKGGKLRRTKVDWFIVAFLAWIVITTIFSISPATALWGKYRRFEGLLSFVNYAVVFFLTVQLVDRPSRVRSLARSLFIGGVIVAFYGLLQAVGLDVIKWGQLPFEANRSFSTYGNPDLLGGYLMFPLPIAIGLWFTEENTAWRFAYGAGFTVILACWITAFVRGAWIGGAFAMLMLGVAAVWLFRRKELSFEAVDAAIGGLVLLAAGTFVFKSLRSTNSVMNVADRLRSIFQFGEGSAKTRFEIWEAAINAIKARPITGFGADTFRLVFPKYKPLAYTRDAGYLSVADNVHDYPLQLASGIGIPGLLLLYIGVFGVVLFLSIRAILGKATGATRYLMFAFWAAAVGYITHLFFGLSVTGSTLLLWFCLGILMSPEARSVEVDAPAWGTIAAGITAVLVAAGFIYNVAYVVADNHYLQARVSQDPAFRATQIKAALAINPWNDMYSAELGLAYQDAMVVALQSTQQQGADKQQALAQAQQSFADAEAALKATIAQVPSEYDNYVFLANLYNQAGAYLGNQAYLDEAIKTADKAIADVEQYGPAIRFQKALALDYKGKRDESISVLKDAIAMDPAYIDPKLLIAQIYQQQGKYADAKKWYQEALKTPGLNQFQQAQAQQGLSSAEASAKAKPSVPATK